LGKIRIEAPQATLDSLESVLQANREGLTLSSFSTTGQEIFGPEVDYTGSIFDRRGRVRPAHPFHPEQGIPGST